MEIIKQGDTQKLKRIKRFICSNCGCIFDADKNEYSIGTQYNETYYFCKCPFCSETVYVNN